MTDELASTFQGPNGAIAVRKVAGDGPCVVWLGGFRSDMTGAKAQYLADWARAEGRAFLRFDYTGHGESEGDFEDGTISRWATDASAAIAAHAPETVILVGSSMGGWIASLIAPSLKSRLAGVVFIAPAPDFTETLMWPNFTAQQRAALESTGRIEMPSDYDDAPMAITRQLIEDGRQNLVLDRGVDISCPVRVLQGMADAEVPYHHALRLVAALSADDVTITLVKNGDHRLSTENDLLRLRDALNSL